MKLNLPLQRQMIIFLIVSLVFMFYMETVYLPHFFPWMYYNNLDILSYPPRLQNFFLARVINVGGVFLFAITFLGGRSLIHLLESLKAESDRLGCIGDKGRYKENELY